MIRLQTPIEDSGDSLAIDGNVVAIGAHLDDSNGMDVGQAHLFDATTGLLLRTLDDPSPTTFDHFGISVDVHGNFVVVGASGDRTAGSGAGQAHLFDTSSGVWLHTFKDPTPTLSGNFGAAVAIDGSHILVGSRQDSTNGPQIGQAHLF